VTVADAAAGDRLADQLKASVERRHPGLAGKAAVRPHGLVVWSEDGRGFAVERRGTNIILLEQVPTTVLDRAREALWRARPAGATR